MNSLKNMTTTVITHLIITTIIILALAIAPVIAIIVLILLTHLIAIAMDVLLATDVADAATTGEDSLQRFKSSGISRNVISPFLCLQFIRLSAYAILETSFRSLL